MTDFHPHDRGMMDAAKNNYATMFDEDAALLEAGYPIDDLDELKQLPGWRRHVAVTNGKTFGRQVRFLQHQASIGSGASDSVKQAAARTLGEWFMPGAQAGVPEGGEDWPGKPG